MLAVDLKIILDTIQRRFTLPTPCPAWDNLAALVKEGFDLPERFKLGLCYQDHDGENITISSTKELASIWPTVTEDDERDLDALPPLRFSIVNIPSHFASVEFHGPPPHHGHRGRDMRFGEHGFGHLATGPGAHDDSEPPKDGPMPPKDGNKDSLKDDVHKFIEAVKTNVTENKEVQDAYKKILEHKRSEHGPKKPEGPAAQVAQMAMQTEGSDALTSGIVAAILTPVFLGPPPPPPHGGPPHGPPHFGHGPGHGRPHHGPPPHGPPPYGPPPHGRAGHGPPGCPPPPPRPGFGPGRHHREGPGSPHHGPGGPPQGHRRHHDGPHPPHHAHGRFGHGYERSHGTHGGSLRGRPSGPYGHGRRSHEGPHRRFRGHPYYGHPDGYRRHAGNDTETVGSSDSDLEFDSDIEDITQGVREMHRNRGAF